MAERLIDMETMESVLVSDSDSAFQNRDFIKWMKRIDKGSEYVESAKRIFNEVTKVATDTARRICQTEWAGAFPEWPLSASVKVDADIKAPVAHKLHNVDDEEDFFVHYREYPFYYVWNVFDVFRTPPTDDRMKEHPEVFSAMFAEKVASRVQSEIVRFIRRKIDGKYLDVFAFPKGKDDFMNNRVNFVVSTSLMFSESKDEPSDDAKFRMSETYRGSVISELAMAMGRILEPIKEASPCDAKESSVKNDAGKAE